MDDRISYSAQFGVPHDGAAGTRAAGAFQNPVVCGVGCLVAYLAVPASLGFRVPTGGLLPNQAVQSAIWILACFGFIAIFRGARVSREVTAIGILFVVLYSILVLVEVLNGDIYNHSRIGRYDLFGIYYNVLLIPLFAIGLREVRPKRQYLDYSMMATAFIAAGWAIFQFLIMGNFRPAGISYGSPSTLGLVALTWSMALLSVSLRSRSIQKKPLIFSLIGAFAVILAGSKLVWACASVGYAAIFLSWIWQWRRWKVLAIGAAFTLVVSCFVVFLFHYRFVEIYNEVSAFIDTGDTSGETFGIRYSMIVSGLHAFFEKPYFGHGLSEVMAAAYAFRPDELSMFTHLNHLHNDYVTHLVAFGFPGLLFLAFVYGSLAFLSLRCPDITMKRFGLSMVGVLIIFGMAEDVFTVQQKISLITLLFGLIAISESKANESAQVVRDG